MSIEAIKQALEALETCMYPQQKQMQAITSLRQAIEQAEKQEHAEQLAKQGWQYFECPACGSEGAKGFLKPVQEPVAWVNWCAATAKRSVSFECESELASQPLYTTPQPQRQWVGLTTDEMKQVADRYHLKPPNVPVAFRVIEAKLKEKNT